MPLSPADRARLDAAVKAEDSPYTTFAISPWSKRLAWAAAGRGLTPNQVTVAALAVAVLAAAGFALGERWAYIVGALLLQLSFGLDCADGQLARLTGRFSPLGAWLDAMFDRLKEYLVYAGLAVGSARAGDDVWLLAVVALVLQTVRHAIDSAWAVTPASVAALAEGVRRRAAGARRRGHWLRKVAILPIGERWLLISVLAALSTPRVVLTVLIAASGLAAAYMLLARVRRSLRPSDPAIAPDAADRLDRMRETGPAAAALARVGPARPGAALLLPLAGAAVIAAALVVAVRSGSALPVLAGAVAGAVLAALGGRRPPGPRWGWVAPPVLRAAEYAVVVVAGLVSGLGVHPVNYGYLLGVIWHHYDAVHPIRHQVAAGDRHRPGLGGFEVRMVAAAALALAGATAYSVGLVAATGLLAVLAVVRGRDLGRHAGPAVTPPAGGSGHR